MSDEQIIEYLRARGQSTPPIDLVRSVMTAVDAAPPLRSWFAPFLPAAAVAAAVAVVAMVAMLLGQGRLVGPAPTPASPPATTSTLAELQDAVVTATERLAATPVEGTQTYAIEGYLASATWFDWRPSGEQVVITRRDIDVEAPWWLDPGGEPLTVGERIETDISVIVGDELYRSDGGAWVVEVAPRSPLTWATGMLSARIPGIGPIDPDDEAVVTRRDLDDGGEVWVLHTTVGEGSAVAEWHIDAAGRLVSVDTQGTDMTLPQMEGLGAASTRSIIEFTPVDDAGPIMAPDPDGAPDPYDVGLPTDFPLAPPDERAEPDG